MTRSASAPTCRAPWATSASTPGAARPAATVTAVAVGADGDRYVSFLGLDCDGRARQVMACVDRLLAAGHGNAYWDYFQKKRQPASGPRPDDLLLLHTSINQVRELFETAEDAPALALLDDLEQTCC